VTRSDRYSVRNAERDASLAGAAEHAGDPVRRGIGLMGRRGLAEGEALIIDPCSGVVSFFMRFPIDVLFLDETGRVIHLVERLRPWRASRIVRGSKRVVELPEGTIAKTGTRLGDQIEIQAIDGAASPS
jgi:uncharacterized protein